MNEIYKAAKKAGFNDSCALYFVSDRATMPEWVIGNREEINIERNLP
jgi:hypothetical protein